MVDSHWDGVRPAEAAVSSKPATILIALTLLAAGACSKDPEQAFRDYMESGRRYADQQRFAEAAIEFANAVQLDPRSGAARLTLAEAHLAAGNTRAAFPQLIRAADMLPDDLAAQLRAGQLLHQGGMFDEAKTRARKVLQKQPGHVDALLLLGNALAGLRSLDEAVEVMRRAIELDPERAGTYTNLGVLRLAQGDQREAEDAFRRAIDVSGGSPETHVGLGNFYRAVGDSSNAESMLRRALELAPDDLAAHRALAALFVSWTGREAEAETHFAAVARLSGAPSDRVVLADYYVARERQADAIAALEALAAEPGQFVFAKAHLALVRFVAGQRELARTAIDEVLARDAGHVGALVLQARLFLAERRYDDALATIKRGLDADPGSGEAHLTKARILLAQGRSDEGRKALYAALSASPGLLPAQLALVELHRERRELDTAITIATDAIREHPASLEARLARLRVWMIRDDDHEKAAADLRELAARLPRSADVLATQGEFQLSRQDPGGARRAFGAALDVEPAHTRALTGMVALDLSGRKTADARRRVDEALNRRPGELPVLLLAARVHGLADDTAWAERTLRRAIELDPSRPEPYAELAQLYLSQNRIDDATRQFVEVARLNPRSVGAPTMLGFLHYVTGQRDEAVAWWEKALALNPQAAAAANNLAWVFAESGTNLERAQQLATLARGKLPNAPEVADTLGWVHYKREATSSALRFLQQAVDGDPRNPVYQFHLGMAHFQAGNDAKARVALTRALDLDPNFGGAAEARETIRRLVY